jgi:hypothetical protein
MVAARRGRSSLGCLVTLLVLAAAVYFGVNVGEVYLRFYRFQDAMKQEARFARVNSDVVIRRRLRARADSLDLPEAAFDIRVTRRGRQITIESEYYEHVELPLFVREVYFHPRAEGSL